MPNHDPGQVDRPAHFVDGAWIDAAAADRIAVVDPTTEALIGTVPAGSADDADRAVWAARRALRPWSALPVGERAGYVTRIAEMVEARSDDLAQLVSREVGTPLRVSRAVQVGLAVGDLRAAVAAADEIRWEEHVGNSVVLREAAGVVACITPWNYPLHQIAAKLAPALVAGCTVVLKPSEVAPLNAFALADIVGEAGLPPGVFNLVSGTGRDVGEALAGHAQVDVVSFTGSLAAGRRVGEIGARMVKRVLLELGGKSPYVVLDDLDDEGFRLAVENGVRKCFLNSGQTCSALTRMLVPRARLPTAERVAAAYAPSFTPGDPLEAGTRLGPLVSAAQRDRVRRAIAFGIAEGARLVAGGIEPPSGLDRGYFVQPTVFSEVRPDMRLAREEIFGPVLSILSYGDDDDAVAIANDSDYGLAAGVWGADRERALSVARRLRAGQVEINGGVFNPAAPFGGFGQSGNGRELGRFGVEEYLEYKALQY